MTVPGSPSSDTAQPVARLVPRVISLPFNIDPTGAVSYTESPVDQLTQRTYSVLATEPGERIMRPDYGCDLRSFDFVTDNDPFLQPSMLNMMRAALQKWEPGALLMSVDVGLVDEGGVLPVTVRFVPASAAAAGDGTDVLTTAVTLGIVAESGAVVGSS